MGARVLIAGGYGLVGSAIARLVREISGDVELVLAGRNPEQGAALARELGGAGTARLDVEDAASVRDLPAVDLVVSALYDPANALLHQAMARGAGHIGITTKADDVAPIAFAVLRSAPKRPIVLLGHCTAGVATIVAAKAAERFSHVETVAVTALHDMRDPVGPMTAGDAEMLVSRALLRSGGRWSWVEGPHHPRSIRLSDHTVLEGYPAGLLDVPSLAAITGAANVRIDMVQGQSLGTLAGGAASSDITIDIEGTLAPGRPGERRSIVSDANGLAHLTAAGVAAAVERVLGLDGRAPAPGGLYLPETLMSPDAAIARYAEFGVRIAMEERDSTDRTRLV
jgi:hypothetical protein